MDGGESDSQEAAVVTQERGNGNLDGAWARGRGQQRWRNVSIQEKSRMQERRAEGWMSSED